MFYKNNFVKKVEIKEKLTYLLIIKTFFCLFAYIISEMNLEKRKMRKRGRRTAGVNKRDFLSKEIEMKMEV